MPRIIKCKICKELKEHYGKGMCKSCYYKTIEPRIIQCKVCKEMKEICAKGKCQICYGKERWKKKKKKYGIKDRKIYPQIIKCPICRKVKKHYVKGLCQICYDKRCWKKTKKKYGIPNLRKYPKIIKCKKCGKSKKHRSKGMCQICYIKEYERTKNPIIIKCKKCGEIKEHGSKEMCKTCYTKKYERTRKRIIIKCKSCGEMKEFHAKGICRKCYSKEQHKKYYPKNIENISQYGKDYYQENKEKRLKTAKESKEKEKEKENKRRKKLGLPLVGEGFKREMELLFYVNNLFKGKQIIHHDRRVLNGLELDIYIPQLKLAFEHQGRQHYGICTMYVKTKEELQAMQFRDQRKKELCKEKGITLIEVRYDEKLTEQLILTKLKQHNIKTNQERF